MMRFLTCSKMRWRAAWLVVAAAHAPATAAALAAFTRGDLPTADWPRLLLLSASNLFFLLEIAFAPVRRLVSSRRAAVVFLAIVAVLHAGVIERGLSGDDAPRGAQAWLLVTAAGAASLPIILRRLAPLAQRRFALALHHQRILPHPLRIIPLGPPPGERVRSSWCASPLRAPPFSAAMA